MRSLSLRVAPSDVEAVLDVVLPVAPRGVHRVAPTGRGEEVELLLFAEHGELPALDLVAQRCAHLVLGMQEGEAPDDWRARRLLTYRPRVIGGRLVVRPAWAPAPSAGLLDVVVSDETGGAFGTGSHPSTRACLEVLLDLPPVGSLADLGCGSGVLAITAAKLGWAPVTAVDLRPDSVAATRANAEHNRVRLEVRRSDLVEEPPPDADTLVANVPLAVHHMIAAQLSRRPTTLIAGGVTAEEVEPVTEAYRQRGLAVGSRLRAGEWAVLVLQKTP